MLTRRLAAIGVLLFPAISLHAAAPVIHATLPLFFTRNAGQYGDRADLVLETAEMSVHFLPGEVIYYLHGGRDAEFHLKYAGRAAAHAEGLDKLPGTLNLLTGSDPNAWTSNVPIYSTVAYLQMWPGIDVIYSLRSGKLKTEFRIAPQAHPGDIKWRADAASVVLARDGSLQIGAGGHQLRESVPQVFERDRATGRLMRVPGSFRSLANHWLTVAVGPYDHRNALIFDPVIGYSTYLGGTGQTNATAVAVDRTGNTIVAGYTTSLDIAPGGISIGAVQRTAAFVAKLTAAGNQLIFCTYLGGDLDNRALALALDRWNNIYLAGSTSSANFPVVRAVQPQMNGAQDAFIAELNPAGNALIFSTYLGGSGAEQAYGVAVSRQGNVYVTGDTASNDFPVVKAFQRASGGGQDAFLVKMGISGSSIVWSSYLGGSADEHAAALALDSSGSPFITGSTLSADFPVAHAFQAQTGGNQDVFLTKVNSSGAVLLFSTYAGGTGGTSGLPESGSGVAVDTAGAVYITGTTSSTGFPVTPGAFQTTSSGGAVDGFVMKFSATGSLLYSTLLSGSSVDYGCAIAVDTAGNAHVAGYTGSSDFPNLRGVQVSLNGGYDAFVTKLNSAGSALIYSTPLGGALIDSAASIAVDRYGTVIVSGQSFSTDFPTLDAYQTTLTGAGSALIARIPVGWTPVLFNSAALWSIDYLRNAGSNGVGPAVQSFSTFGIPGDIPIAGDWSRTGHQNIGVFRNGTWYLDMNGNTFYDSGDRSFVFGQAGDLPVLGDWDGSGTIKAGLFRNGVFILDFSGHLSGIPTGNSDVTFALGAPGDIPIAADWNGSGSAKVGVFRSGQWLLDFDGSHTLNGPVHSFGEAGDIPLLGDWDGSATVKAGIYRSGSFLLDYNGNWIWDPYGDVTLVFGPVTQYALITY